MDVLSRHDLVRFDSEPAPVSDDELCYDEEPLSDEELTELALAADPDAPLPADAKPFDAGLVPQLALLPSWYMAPVVGRIVRKKRYKIAIAVLIGAFLLIDAFGLCATYGPLTLA